MQLKEKIKQIENQIESSKDQDKESKLVIFRKQVETVEEKRLEMELEIAEIEKRIDE